MQDTKTMNNRIARATFDPINRKIACEIEARVAYYASHPEQIEQRLAALQREWGIERTLIINASTLSLIGLFLALVVKRAWLALPVVVMSFLFQHGLQGWCPPLPLFRRMGIRTKEEILRERYALRALRGDLNALCEGAATDPDQRAQQVLRAVDE